MNSFLKPLLALGAVIVALTALVAADSPTPAPATPPTPPAATPGEDPEAILEVKPATGHLPAGFQPSESLRDIVKMAQAGVSEDVLLTYIRGAGKAFHPSPEDIIFLNDLGVGEAVLKSLIDSRDGSTTAATPATKPPASVLLSTNTPVTAAPAINGVVAQPAADAPPAPAADSTTVVVTEPAPVTSVNYFYDSLAPYGSWVNVSGYGWCWQPTVAVANVTWRPYCDNGRWVYSNYGWYWHSGYSWGWAPFHYGRWYNHGTCGWLWQPDTVWSASWVSWRYSSQYCGWAPLPPAAYYRPGFGFSYYNGNVSVGIGFDFGLSYHHYNYVPVNQFCAPNPRHHVARHTDVQAIHNHTTVVNNYVTGDNNTVINHGIGRDRITRGGRTPIPEVTVRDAIVRASAPGATTRIERESGRDIVYRPVLGRPNLAGPDRNDRRPPGTSTATSSSGTRAPAIPAPATVSTPAPATVSSTTPPGRTPPTGSPRTTRPTSPTPAPAGTAPATAATSTTTPPGRSGAPGAAPGSAVGRDDNRSERVNQLIEEARRQSVARNSRGPGNPAAPGATAPVTTAPVAGTLVGSSGGASPTPTVTRTPPGRTPPRSSAPAPAPTPAPTVAATPQPVAPQPVQPSVQPRTQSPRLTQERVTELVRELQRQREQPRSAPAPNPSVNVTPRPTPQPIQRQNSYTPPAPAPAPTPSAPIQSQRPTSGYVPTRELPPGFDRSRITPQPNSSGRPPVSPAPAPAPAPAPVTRSAPPAPAPSGGGSVSGGSSRAVESRGNVQRGGSQSGRGGDRER